MMADWRDVIEARRAADDAMRRPVDEWTTDGQLIYSALEAIRLELRALGTLLDHATPDDRARAPHRGALGRAAPLPREHAMGERCFDGTCACRLREALSFYANPSSWEESAPPPGSLDGVVPAHEDRGDKARAALEADA